MASVPGPGAAAAPARAPSSRQAVQSASTPALVSTRPERTHVMPSPRALDPNVPTPGSARAKPPRKLPASLDASSAGRRPTEPRARKLPKFRDETEHPLLRLPPGLVHCRHAGEADEHCAELLRQHAAGALGALGMVKVASCQGHVRPPRAREAASAGLRLPSALGRGDQASQIPPRGRGIGARPHGSHRFRRV